MPEGGCILRNQWQTEMKTSKHNDEANVYELLMFGGTVKLANNKYRRVQYNLEAVNPLTSISSANWFSWFY